MAAATKAVSVSRIAAIRAASSERYSRQGLQCAWLNSALFAISKVFLELLKESKRLSNAWESRDLRPVKMEKTEEFPQEGADIRTPEYRAECERALVTIEEAFPHTFHNSSTHIACLIHEYTQSRFSIAPRIIRTSPKKVEKKFQADAWCSYVTDDVLRHRHIDIGYKLKTSSSHFAIINHHLMAVAITGQNRSGLYGSDLPPTCAIYHLDRADPLHVFATEPHSSVFAFRDDTLIIASSSPPEGGRMRVSLSFYTIRKPSEYAVTVIKVSNVQVWTESDCVYPEFLPSGGVFLTNRDNIFKPQAFVAVSDSVLDF